MFEKLSFGLKIYQLVLSYQHVRKAFIWSYDLRHRDLRFTSITDSLKTVVLQRH